jgi:hypothetical protein
MANTPVKRNASRVPAISDELYRNMPKYASSEVMGVYEMIGGTKAMAAWAEENQGDFYTKLFGKLVAAPKQLEVSGKISVEEIIKILDMEEGKDFTMVEPEDAHIEEDENDA